MALTAGIVGLPNVGNLLYLMQLHKQVQKSANYPFCTIDPNVGIVEVPDERLQQINRTCPTEKNSSN